MSVEQCANCPYNPKNIHKIANPSTGLPLSCSLYKSTRCPGGTGSLEFRGETQEEIESRAKSEWRKVMAEAPQDYETLISNHIRK